MDSEKIRRSLEGLQDIKIAVLGDFALDFYFDLDKEQGEVSLETGKTVFHASQPRPLPGGAGTIVNNLKALGIQDIPVFGLIGDDLFGRELRFLLEQQGVDTTGLLTAGKDWETYVYTKPLEKGKEANRIDFGSRNIAKPEDCSQIWKRLETCLPNLDVLIINQQFETGLTAPQNLPGLVNLLAKYPDCYVISDLRNSTGAFRYGIIKGNVSEISRSIKQSENGQHNKQLSIVQKVSQQMNCPVLMTRGEEGMVYAEGRKYYDVPGIALEEPLDITGAGDACLSAFAACMGKDIPIPEALAIANLAAAVTVQKLKQTGTASPEEIIALAKLKTIPRESL